jgi:hypothetical protein
MTDTEQFICDLLVTHLTLNSSSSSFSFSLWLFQASDFSFLLMDPLDIW